MKQKKLSRLFIFLISFLLSLHAVGQYWNPGHRIGTTTGVYHFNYNQTPAQLVELQAAAIPNTGLTYQWEQSTTPDENNFSALSGATSSSYTFSGPLSQTTYFRRKTIYNGVFFIYSNI